MISNEYDKNATQIIIQSVLRRSQENISFLIEFVEKWNHLITENG